MPRSPSVVLAVAVIVMAVPSVLAAEPGLLVDVDRRADDP